MRSMPWAFSGKSSKLNTCNVGYEDILLKCLRLFEIKCALQIKEGDSSGVSAGDPVAGGRLQEGGAPLQVREIHPA